jgi:hypothetical protein
LDRIDYVVLDIVLASACFAPLLCMHEVRHGKNQKGILPDWGKKWRKHSPIGVRSLKNLPNWKILTF